MDDVFGKKLGQYILLEQLGEGGMAKVYNAFDSRMERNVAIKVILPSKRSSQVFLEQFKMEARALANLTHTNIVKVLNYGVENEQPFLVMEYVPGGTLKDAMNQKLPWQTAAGILAPIARALDYVHSQQIVHRDVKPSNILLQEDFRPMLSDFGILKLLEGKEEKVGSAIGVGVGTPEYMSPEQGMGREVDFRADIYSLGLVFYELVTGRKPFTADTPMAMVLKHVTDELPPPTRIDRKIPKFVEQAMLRAVHKKPEDRYTNMGEFADALEMIALGKNAPEKKIIQLARQRKKRPAFLPVAGLLLLLATIAGASLWGYERLSPRGTETTAASSPIPAVVLDDLNATATPEPAVDDNSPTPTSPPAVISTRAPSTNPLSGVALLETRLPSGQVDQFKEISRWGIGGVNVIAWSPDGNVIALGTTNGLFLYGAQDKSLKLFIDTRFNVVAMVFSPEGDHITAGSPDGDVTAWNAATGKTVQNFSYKQPQSNRIITSASTASRFVKAISYSPNGRNIAVGYENGTIDYFSTDRDTAIAAFDEYPMVEDLAVSGDGRFIYASNGGRSISVWDIQAGTRVSELSHSSSVSRISMSRNREFLLSGGSASSVYLWDLFETRLVSSFPVQGGIATDFDFSYDDKYVVIGMNTGEVRVFEVPQPEDYSKTHIPILKVKEYEDQIRSVAFSPNQLIAAAGNWEEGLKLWDVLGGEVTFSLDESMRPIDQIFFSADGSWLATSHDGRTVRIWRVASAEQAYQVDGYLAGGNPFSPDNKYLATVYASGSNRAEAVRIVELASGDIVANLPGYPAKSFIQFSDDSKILIAGTPYIASLWDVATWEQVESHGGPTAGCGQYFTPENKLLTVISNAGITFSYNPELCGTRIQGATLMYFFPPQNQLLFVLGDGNIWLGNSASPDISRKVSNAPHPLPGEIFLAGDQERGWYAYVSGAILRFSIPSSSVMTVPSQDDYQYRVALLPDKKLIALGSRYGSIHIWKVP